MLSRQTNLPAPESRQGRGQNYFLYFTAPVSLYSSVSLPSLFLNVPSNVSSSTSRLLPLKARLVIVNVPDSATRFAGKPSSASLSVSRADFAADSSSLNV